MSFTSGGLITFTTLTAGGNLIANSSAGDVIGTTATATGNASVTGAGIGIQALNSLASTFLAANGPVSLADPYAGNVIIEGINNSASGGLGINVTATANGSIFVPTIIAKTGSISLTAVQDIEVPALIAGTGISTTANGVTNVVIATTGNGAIDLTGGQTITFREVTAGGSAGDVNIVSTSGFVLGIPSLSVTEDGISISRNTVIDGSVTAGRNATFQGAGIGVLNVTAHGGVTMKAYGFAYPHDGNRDRDDPAYAGPQLLGIEPNLLGALTNLWNIQVSPGSSYALSLFNNAGGALTHGANYSLTAAPLNFTFLTRTLTEVTAGLMTLSPLAPPPPTEHHADWPWQAAVVFAYDHPPPGTTSGALPYPWGSFNPADRDGPEDHDRGVSPDDDLPAIYQLRPPADADGPGENGLGWWTGGIDFQNIISQSRVSLTAGSTIDGGRISVGSCQLSVTAGLLDYSKARFSYDPDCDSDRRGGH
jgi:hypothetical protein